MNLQSVLELKEKLLSQQKLANMQLLAEYKFFNKNADHDLVEIFNIDTCDHCNEPVIGANSIKISMGKTAQETISNLTAAGLLPAEIETNETQIDDNGGCYCGICYDA